MGLCAKAIAVCILTACCGCFGRTSASFGEVIMTTGAEVQMLSPAQSARACGTTWGVGSTDDQRPLAAVLSDLAASVPEGNALTNIQVSWSVQDLAIVRRVCVVATADVVRTIRVIRLPGVGHEH
jgi:hypothetical protein